MKNINTLFLPRWIVPIEPSNQCLEHHALAVDEGRILDILPAAQAKQIYQPAQIIELKSHVLMPGLINCHTHSPMTLFRGLADDLALMDWLQNHIWPAEKKWLSNEFCYDGTQVAILEMLRSGTTCFNENFFFCEGIAKAVHESYIRACLGPTVIDFPTSYANHADENLNKLPEFYEQWQQHPLISLSISPHAPYSVSDETFLKIKKMAEKYSLRIHLHLHETADEIKQGIQQYNKRPIQRIYDLGLMSDSLECVHMTQITDDDVALLKKTGAHVISCPESNLKLASGFSPLEKFWQAGVNIALGTDGPASNNDLDMFGEMRTASLLAKAVAQNSTALSAVETLYIATLGGAKALGLNKMIGSLVPGKMADMIAVDLEAINSQPIYHPISHLVYAVNSRQVSDVWVAGKQLVKNGKFTTLNENAILSKAILWQEKIATSN